MTMASICLNIGLAFLLILQTCPSGVLSWARYFKNEDECISYYANMTVEEGRYCHTMWDGILCWPPSPYQAVALLPCPPHGQNIRGTGTAYKRCSLEGKWEDIEDPSSFRQSSSREYRSGPPTPVAPNHPCLDDTQDAESTAGVITAYSVFSRIEHRYAMTYVKATVINTDPHPTRLPFKMTLPENAFISSLVMEIDGTNYTSTVRQKPIANRSYQVSKERHNDAVLVEQNGITEFKVSANIVSRKVTFYVKYEEPLRRVNGHYIQKIHIRPGTRIPEAEVSIHIVGDEDIGDYRILELPGQELHGNPGAHVSETFVNAAEVRVNYKHVGPPNGPGRGVDGTFTIAYNLKSHGNGVVILRTGNYFNHFIALDSGEKMPKLPTHTVFALDVSDSMGKYGKLDQMKDGLRTIIKAMDATDSFEILAFSSDVATLGIFNGTHFRKALRRIKKLQPMSYSNLNAAYMQALKSANEFTSTFSPIVKQIVIITDGHPTKGIVEPAVIRRNVRDSNVNGYPIFGIGFGPETHFNLIEQISADSQASARHMKNTKTLAHDLEVFCKGIARPILTDFSITYPDDEVDPVSVFKNGNSNFYSGGEIISVGRMYGVRNVHPRITGVGSRGVMHLQTQQNNHPDFTVSEDELSNSAVVRLWAFITIQNLTKQAKLSDNYPHVKRLLDQATHLAMKFRFVTLVTSLVVRDATGEYEVDSASADLPHLSANHEPAAAYVGPPSILRPTRKQALVYQQYVDEDPHFVVSPPGLNKPLCFDYHAHDGAYISLIRDKSSGIIVNAQTTSHVERPKLTYITKLFIALGRVNITLTPNFMEVDCIDDDGNLKVDHVTKSLWPFYKRNGKKYKKRMADFHARQRPLRRNLRRSSTPAQQGQVPKTASESLVNPTLITHHPTRLPLGDARSEEAVHFVMSSDSDDYIPHHDDREQERFSRQSVLGARRDHSRRRPAHNDHNLCSFNSSWKDGAGKKYGDVMVVLYKKRNMHIMIGDGQAHFVIVRARKDSQLYLVFYLQDEEVMSPNTRGLIGQFTSKVITVNSSIPAVQPHEKPKVELLVQRRTAKRRQRQRKARVIGTFSSRISNSDQDHVDCIAVRQARRLLDGKPEDYLLSCLQC